MIGIGCVPLGFVKVTVATTAAQGLAGITVTGTTTFVIPSGANLALFTVEGVPVRWRDDGIAPTPTSGMPVGVTVAPFDYTGNISALQFIASSVSATVDVALYKTVG